MKVLKFLNPLFFANYYDTFWASLGLSGKEFTYNAGDTGDARSIPGSGGSLGEGNGNPLLYSCLENPMDRGTWQVTVQWVVELD